MKYDSHFDKNRLEQLATQHLSDASINGRVLFFSESADNRLDYATWQFEDEAYQVLKDSGFKTQLMELLDILLIYRAQHNQSNASQGVAHVNGKRLSVEWLPKESVEVFRES